MIDIARVGEKIAYYRKLHNLTQDELALKLYVTRQAISKWEKGISIPSIDMLLEICNEFQIGFEDILCLDEDDEIDPNDIFKGHDRLYVIQKIIKNELKIYIPDYMYLLSPSERMMILKAIKEGKISTDLDELIVKLTKSEQQYLLKGELIKL